MGEFPGCNRFRGVRGLRPSNNSAGERPVVVWGVFRYWNKKRASLHGGYVSAGLLQSIFERLHSSLCQAVAGWVICRTTSVPEPVAGDKCLELLACKRAAVVGNQEFWEAVSANVERRNLMVLVEDVEGMMLTSSHFEWASTSTTNIFPWKGPAKSI